jgi:RNA polymerase sigma factor (sigma-70 family)
MFTPTINLDNATEAIDTLAPEYRQAIHLAYYAGFTNSQVADLLGVTPAVADSRLSEGLTHLREALRVAA